MDAPLAVKVVELPLQIVLVAEIAVIVGVASTVIVCTALFVLVHPVKVFVPFTIYDKVVEGVKAVALVIPPLQV